MNHMKSKMCDIKISAVIMASGHGKRFGSNKLLAELKGIPVIEYLFKQIPSDMFDRVCVVSGYEEILKLAEEYNFFPVYNSDTTDNTAITIKTGISNIPEDSSGCMFFTGDQPLLKKESIISLIKEFLNNPDKIYVSKSGNNRGNPVIFPEKVFQELMNLPENHQGKMIIKAHEDIVSEHNIENPKELMDIDYECDLRMISEMI